MAWKGLVGVFRGFCIKSTLFSKAQADFGLDFERLRALDFKIFSDLDMKCVEM